MKNQLKNPPPDLPVRRRRRLPQFFRLTGFALAFFVLLILFALLTVGLPPDLTRKITVRLRENGIPLQIKSIRLSMHHGWVLDNAALYSTSPDDLQPLLKARKLYIMLWPVDWKNLADGGWSVRVHVKDLGISLGRPWEDSLPEDHPFRTISLLDASLSLAPGRVDMDNAEMHWGNIKLFARGKTAFSGIGKAESPQGKDFRRRIAKAADALSELKCEKPPEINLTFNYNDALPSENFMETFLSAEGIYWENRIYERLSGALEYRNNTWTVPAMQLNRSAQEQLILHGAINFETGNTEVSVENSLSAEDLFSLLPPEARSAVAQTGIKPFGRLNFSVSAGPANLEKITETIDAQVRQLQFTRKDITVDPLSLQLTRNGNQVEIRNLKAGLNGAPLTGSFSLDLDSKAWKARIKTQCNPSLAGEYDEDLAWFLQRFSFPVELPRTDLSLSQTALDQPVVMNGTISADRFTCGGVLIDHVETFMTYSNQVVDLTPLHAVRGDKTFDGSIQVDFNTGIAAFSATNSFPPADVARALAPDFRTILEDIRFDGSIHAAGHGQIDYRNWTHHRFQGSLRAENIGYGKAQAALFTSDVAVDGNQLMFTNASAKIYNGTANGSGEFDISLEDGTAPYHINARITQIELSKMLGQISADDYSRIKGQLTTSFDISADAKAGFWNSVHGTGQAKIENGRLADLPLFGGLSRLIQTAFSGFNLFSLTTFSADYALHDGAIWSDNTQLGGTLFSAKGRGSYSPTNGLNFSVVAEPFRQSGGESKEWYQLQRWAADALKEGTSPLFRLLEFQLSGPLDKPDWRFVNLSKDIAEPLRSSVK